MTTRKRASGKGRGADVFLTEEASAVQTPAPESQPSAAPAATPAAHDPVPAEKRIMVTFYLPPALVDHLDQVWIERRRRDRKVQKSHIVTEALEAYLKD